MLPVFERFALLLLLLCDGGLSAAIAPLRGGEGDASVMVQMQPMQGILRSEGQADPDANEEDLEGELDVDSEEEEDDGDEPEEFADEDMEDPGGMDIDENDPAQDMDDPSDEFDPVVSSETSEAPEAMQSVKEEDDEEEAEDEAEEEEELEEDADLVEVRETDADSENQPEAAEEGDDEESHKLATTQDSKPEEAEEEEEDEEDEEDEEEEDEEIEAEGEAENETALSVADVEGAGCKKDLYGSKKMIIVKTVMKMKPNDPAKKCKGGTFTGTQIWKTGTAPANGGNGKKRKAVMSFLYKACSNIIDIHWKNPNGKSKGDRDSTMSFKAKPNQKYFFTVYARDNKDCTLTVGKKNGQVDFMTTFKCNMWKTFKNKKETIEVRNNEKGTLVEKGKNVCDEGKKRTSCVKFAAVNQRDSTKYCKTPPSKTKKTCKCSAWGDVHYSCKCKGKVKVDYMGSGPHKVLKMAGGKFDLQAFNCPIERKKTVSVQVAVAVKLGKSSKVDGKKYQPTLTWRTAKKANGKPKTVKPMMDGEPLDVDAKLCVWKKVEPLGKCQEACEDDDKKCLKKCRKKCKILVEVYKDKIKIVGPKNSGATPNCNIKRRTVKDSPTGSVMDVKCDLPVAAYARNRIKGLMVVKKLNKCPKEFLKRNSKKNYFFTDVPDDQSKLWDACCADGVCDAPGSIEPMTKEQACKKTPGCQKNNLLGKAKTACKSCKKNADVYDSCIKDFCSTCGSEDVVGSSVDTVEFDDSEVEDEDTGGDTETSSTPPGPTTTTTTAEPTAPAKCKKGDMLDLHGAKKMLVVSAKLKMQANNPKKKCAGGGFTGFQIWTSDNVPAPGWEKKSKKFEAIFAALVLGCKKKAEIHWNTERLTTSERWQPVKLPFKIKEGRDYFMTLKFMDNGDCIFEIGKKANIIKFSMVKACDVYSSFFGKTKLAPLSKLTVINDHKRGAVTQVDGFDKGGSRTHWVTLTDKPAKKDAMPYCKTPVMDGLCQCSAYGDVHYKCLCGKDKQKKTRYDYQRSGAHTVLQLPTVTAESFHCPSRRGAKAKLVSIQVAFAAKIKTKKKNPFKITYYRKLGSTKKMEAWVTDPAGVKTLVDPGEEKCLATNGKCKAFTQSSSCSAVLVVTDGGLEIATKDAKGKNIAIKVQKKTLPLKSSPVGYVLRVTTYFSKSAFNAAKGTSVAKNPNQAKKAFVYLQHSFVGTERQKQDMFEHCCNEEGICDPPEGAEPTPQEVLEDACLVDGEDYTEAAKEACKSFKDDEDNMNCMVDACGMVNPEGAKKLAKEQEKEEEDPEVLECPPLKPKDLPKPTTTPKPKPPPTTQYTPWTPVPSDGPAPPNPQEPYEPTSAPTPPNDCGNRELGLHGSTNTLSVLVKIAGKIPKTWTGLEVWHKDLKPPKDADPEGLEDLAAFSAWYMTDTKKAKMRPNHKSPRARGFRMAAPAVTMGTFAVQMLFRDNGDCSFQYGFKPNDVYAAKDFRCKVWKAFALDKAYKMDDPDPEVKAILKKVVVANPNNFVKAKKTKTLCYGGTCLQFLDKYVDKTKPYCKKVPKVCACNAWGDVHFNCECVNGFGKPKTVYHYQGSGAHVMLDYQGLLLEAMQCPVLDKPKKLSIQVAFSFRVVFNGVLYQVQWFRYRKVQAFIEGEGWTGVEDAADDTAYCLAPDENGGSVTLLGKTKDDCATTKVVWQKPSKCGKVYMANIIGPVFKFETEENLFSVRLRKRIIPRSPVGWVIDVYTRLPRKWFTNGNIPEGSRGTLLASTKEEGMSYRVPMRKSTVGNSDDKGIMDLKCCQMENASGVCESEEPPPPFVFEEDCGKDEMEDVDAYCKQRGAVMGYEPGLTPPSDGEHTCRCECCETQPGTCKPEPETPVTPEGSPSPPPGGDDDTELDENPTPNPDTDGDDPEDEGDDPQGDMETNENTPSPPPPGAGPEPSTPHEPYPYWCFPKNYKRYENGGNLNGVDVPADVKVCPKYCIPKDMAEEVTLPSAAMPESEEPNAPTTALLYVFCDKKPNGKPVVLPPPEGSCIMEPQVADTHAGKNPEKPRYAEMPPYCSCYPAELNPPKSVKQGATQCSEPNEDGGGGDLGVQSTGDPHCENVRGEVFDVHATGDLTFVAVPANGARGRDLTVQATVTPVNSHPCSPTVITKLRVEGQWLGRAPSLTLLPGASGVPEMPPSWHRWMARVGSEDGNVSLAVKGDTPRMNLRVGDVQVQVKQRRGFRTGITYFDVQVKGLGSLGPLAGGILGIDDHKAEEAAAPGCDPHATVRLARDDEVEGEEASEGQEELLLKADSKMLSTVEVE